MKILIMVSLLIFAIFLVGCQRNGIEIEDYPKIEEVQSIDDIVKNYVDHEGTNALSIGIIKNGEKTFYNYGTIASDDASVPTEKSIYEIGSISKTFTAAVFSAMIDEGKVQMDDPIKKYLPEGVVNWSESHSITLEELANHTSGMPRLPKNLMTISNFDLNDPYANYDAAALYEFLKTYKPKAKNKRKADYSNLGMGLLGHILALVNETDYETLIKQYITNKLDMPETSIQLSEAQMSNLAKGHNWKGESSSLWGFASLEGAGGIRSNTEDMLNFVEANIKKQLSFERTHQATHDFGDNTKIGLAWLLTPSKNKNVNVIWHNGGTGGYSTFTGFIDGQDVGVIVLSNTAVSVDEIGLLVLEYLAE